MENFYEELRQLNKEVKERFEKLERRVRKNEVISGFYEGIYWAICDNLVDCYDFEDIQIPKALLDEVWSQRPHLSDEAFNELWLEKISPYKKYQRKRDKYIKHVRRSIDSVKNCSRFFEIDYYPLQGVKDIIKTTSCNNPFCDTCQSKIAEQRYERFAPVLDVLLSNFDVAHIVVTVPNCKPKDLLDTVERMYESRKYLIRYLKGDKKIRGIDLESVGFEGGISALEITRKEADGTFHPHFHCAFIFRKNSGVFARGTHINCYSFDNKNKEGEPRRYNDFEILLQKIWRLKFDHREVNVHNIRDLSVGYDCICERKTNFHEVFKYCTKGIIKWDKDVRRVLGQYTDFVYLDRVIYARRIIQTYGCLRGIPLSDEVDQTSENDLKYQEFIEHLRQLENPIAQIEYLETLLDEQKNDLNIKYISRKNIKSFLGAEDEWELSK